MAWSWESQQLTPSPDGGDGDGGTEDSVELPKSPATSQFDDPSFLAIMEHKVEPTLGDSNKEHASGKEVPVEGGDDDNEEEEKEEEELMVPLAEEAPVVGAMLAIPQAYMAPPV
jgi:hypothetical protein